MNLFHKIVYKTIPINMPDYLTRYNGDSRLRSTYLDNLSFVSNIASTTTSINNLNKSSFFRSHTFWNSLPFDIRSSMSLLLFKNKLYKHLWNIALTDIEQSEDEWSFHGPQMMMDKPKQGKTFCATILGYGWGIRVMFLFFHHIPTQILI